MKTLPLTAPLEDGGHSCGYCGELLTHDDFKGANKGDHFVVMGYYCRACGRDYTFPRYEVKTKWGKRPYMKKFDWRQIATSGYSRHSGACRRFENDQGAVYA